MMQSITRQLAALLLLLCLGLSVPAVAGPMHICLAELLGLEAVEDDCCDHGDSCCDSEGPLESNCCLDIQDLPDAQAPNSPEPTPEAPVIDLGWISSISLLHSQFAMSHNTERPDRIRGPCSASDHRALLEIWRL